MTKTAISSDFPQSKWISRFEYVLLVFCMAVVVLRVISSESLNTDGPIDLTDSLYSLSISALLVSAFICWLIVKICRSRFLYRFTAIEIGLALFCVAAVIAGPAASNKRAAITGFVTMLTPFLLAVLLVQILDTCSKVKLLLYIIAGLGALTAAYCLCQSLWINDMIINEYHNDPNSILQNFGIQPGSFQKMLFEHSLYSRDVRGFFTTGNSAGSFLLLSLFSAIALFVENLRGLKKNPKKPLPALISAGFAFLCILGLIATHSKGAITATVLASAMFITYLLFGHWLQRYKKTVLIICLLIISVIGYAAIRYGLTYGRLPGGNSMLVRWQYWQASAKMYADHWPAGVGPGNFAQFYPHYKPACAPETVADPHNFVLSLLTQYGPIGLLGFLAAVLIPLARAVFTIAANFSQHRQTNQRQNLTIAVLFCAIIAFLFHNCVDFAIFEPAIMTTFWIVMACFIALDIKQKNRTPFILKPVFFTKLLITAAALTATWAYLHYALIPVAKAEQKIKHSMKNPENAHRLLSMAAEDDPLDPKPLNLNGRLYLQHYNDTFKSQPALLEKAAESFLAAIDRNPASYKNYEKLTQTYMLLAQTSTQRNSDLLSKAFEAGRCTVDRYPGSGRLRFELAKIAEQLNKTEEAIEQYKKAIEIEDSYRSQFRMMYPDREVFSRLGEEKYKLAKERVQQLSK